MLQQAGANRRGRTGRSTEGRVSNVAGARPRCGTARGTATLRACEAWGILTVGNKRRRSQAVEKGSKVTHERIIGGGEERGER